MKKKGMTAVALVCVMIMVPVSVLGGEKGEESGRTKKVGWFRRLFGTLTWDEAISLVDSPASASGQVRKHVRYRADQEDTWEDGKTTWQRGYGDCEDMAAAVVDLLKAKGIPAEIYAFIRMDAWEGHAVAMGRYKGKLWFSTNGWFETVDSLDEAIEEISWIMGWRGPVQVKLLADVWHRERKLGAADPEPKEEGKIIPRTRRGRRYGASRETRDIRESGEGDKERLHIAFVR